MWRSYIGYVAGNSGEERVTEPDRSTLFDVPLEAQFAKRSNVKINHQRYMNNSVADSGWNISLVDTSTKFCMKVP